MTYHIVATKCWSPAEGLTLDEAEIIKTNLEAEDLLNDFQIDGLTTYEIVEEEL